MTTYLFPENGGNNLLQQGFKIHLSVRPVDRAMILVCLHIVVTIVNH